MIALEVFNKTEKKMLHLAKLWNVAESVALHYEKMFESTPHELATIILNGTTFADWQTFLSDSRVQEYIDKVLYVKAGIIVSTYMKTDAYMKMADTTKLNAAIKYRDDHKPSFAVPVQYIYIQTPLTKSEKEFLPDIPENKRPGL